MIVLDTDVTIDLLREHPAANAWLASLGDERVALPGYVVMELLQGCRDRAEVRELRRDLRDFQVLWPDAITCAEAMETYSRAWLSHGLAILDALIGHTALALGAPLYTFNTKHFAAIPGLKTIKPYKR